MVDITSAGDRRPQRVATVGFWLQLASFLVLTGIAYFQKSQSGAAVARLMVVGIPIWLVLWLVIKQICRVMDEALETEELQRTREAGMATAIFESDDENLLIEQNRLNWMARWLLPGTTILLAVGLLVGHFLIDWGWKLETAFQKDGFSKTEEPTLIMWFAVGVGFGNFLFARYTLAVSRIAGWRLLHAGAVCMAANAIASIALAVALMSASSFAWAEPLIGTVLRVGLVILAVELGVNYVLDFYRPRVRGEIARPSFDSRLLGLISEPGGIAKSIADAVNYQFGFEVSSTWFYQLLQRWMFPIMVFTLVAVLALTSLVVVEAGEAVVIERLGRLQQGKGEVLGPGLHFKRPFPFDIVYRAPANRVNEVVLGEATVEDDKDSQEAILWTKAHEYVPELMVLVAAPKEFAKNAQADSPASKDSKTELSESVPVSLLMLSVPIQYRISDVHKFLYQYAEPVKLLESVAYQFLSDYAAGIDIDTLMGSGGDQFNKQLRPQLQKRLDELDLGIELVFVGLRGAHPPARDQVAEAFQKVISAQTSMGTKINAAEGEAWRILIGAAGSVAAAEALDTAIRKRDALRTNSKSDPAEIAKADAAIDELLIGASDKGKAPVGGRASMLIANARGNARQATSDAQVKVRSFGAQVAAYSAAPTLYQQRKFLDVYAGMSFIRKYLIIGDPSNVIIQYQTAEQAGLDRILTEGLDKEKKLREKP